MRRRCAVRFESTRRARDLLGITTAFTDSPSMGLTRTKGDRVLEILNRTGATAYVSRGKKLRSRLTPVNVAHANGS